MRFVFKSCRIRIQTVVGTRASGAESTRTFSIKHVKEDVTPDQAAALVRAIAAVLDRDIASAQLVCEYEIVDDAPVRAAATQKPHAAPTAARAVEPTVAPTAAPMTAPTAPDLAALLSREPLYVSELLAGAGYIDTS